ncbi:MAG: KUP/HAK/KT family potassium transporter, partial [Myxococcales bacterium]|nr:KUP/HAK/KT family potassium transporter [Myxococcales bacterium]
SYLGQGALLLGDPSLISNPFFHLAPAWARVPVLILATVATIIASQAVISGAFSLTMQAVQLGFLPRMSIRHTSETEFGQVYVPLVNFLLCVASVATVVAFGSSNALAGAYGVAVSTTMVITTALLFFAMHRRWRWPLPVAAAVAVVFLAVDLTFLVANVEKIPEGGWLPLALGGLVVVVMATWRTGARAVSEQKSDTDLTLAELREEIDADPTSVLPGTAVLLHPPSRDVPGSLVRLYRFTSAIHERNVFLTIAWWRIPFIHR